VSFQSNDSTLVDVSQTNGTFIQLSCNHLVTKSKGFLLQVNIDGQLIQVIKHQSISHFHYSQLVQLGFVIGIQSRKKGFLQPDSCLLLWCSFCQRDHKLDRFRVKRFSGQQITLYNTCWAKVNHGVIYSPIYKQRLMIEPQRTKHTQAVAALEGRLEQAQVSLTEANDQFGQEREQLVNKGILKTGDVGSVKYLSESDKNGCHSGGVVPRTYRPPDVLIGNCKYGLEIDVWTAGCVSNYHYRN
jgi:serine/threonine protein kinase